KRLIYRTASTALPRLPGRWFINLQLCVAWLCIRVVGWDRSIGIWRPAFRHGPSRRDSDESRRLVTDLAQRIRAAASGHLLNPQCKETSLVAWRLLRGRFGYDATLVIGVMPYPFQLHAWVECESMLVTDDRDHCELYEPVFRYQ